MSRLKGIKGVVASRLVLEHIAELLDQHEKKCNETVAEVARLVAAKSRTRLLGVFPRRALDEKDVERMIRDSEAAPWWWSFAGAPWPTCLGNWVDIPGSYGMSVKELKSLAWLAKRGGPTIELDGEICRMLGLQTDPRQ